jgi:hypothetical protein
LQFVARYAGDAAGWDAGPIMPAESANHLVANPLPAAAYSSSAQ